ncbi:hypothetical protein CFIMG_006388RAa [Ceratocystis fimbriata CBS 114723]|uniref:Uncharacterized protein n=1 Tax=Ceratocystis fimbriata CBS 114723 TaxID=1035309 RepID=A0A2C5WFL7_9PEZI|nr:hypothetical protein CFIMG_006388RAa [Ceratocystis fimbriata CBS 114723]
MPEQKVRKLTSGLLEATKSSEMEICDYERRNAGQKILEREMKNFFSSGLSDLIVVKMDME